MNKPRKRRIKLGDIYEIPLPDGKKAYGRLYKECTLAIYKGRYNDVSELSQKEEYESYIAVYKELLQDREWPIVANRNFASEEDAWPPPKVMVDAITKKGSLYYKGVISSCMYEECKDLEVVAVWDRQHVVDRLMGIDTWEKLLGRPKDPNASPDPKGKTILPAVPQDFKALYRAADALLKKDATAEQVIALCAGNVIYTLTDHDIMSGNIAEELQKEQQLQRDNNTEVDALVCMWQTGALDIPSKYFRDALVNMNPENKKTKVLLVTFGGYIVKMLEEIG